MRHHRAVKSLCVGKRFRPFEIGQVMAYINTLTSLRIVCVCVCVRVRVCTFAFVLACVLGPRGFQRYRIASYISSLT